jgi:hypothetical protein
MKHIFLLLTLAKVIQQLKDFEIHMTLPHLTSKLSLSLKKDKTKIIIKKKMKINLV